MKAWKDELSPVDIQNVISFIHTLQGTQPANPKAAEGELYEEEVSSADLGNDSSKITGMKNIEVK